MQCKLETLESCRLIVSRWKKKRKILPDKKHAFLTCILNLANTFQTETITLKEVRSNWALCNFNEQWRMKESKELKNKISTKCFYFQVSVVIELAKRMLKSDFNLPKNNCFYLLQWKLFNNDEKCFLFYLKSSFRSWDI